MPTIASYRVAMARMHYWPIARKSAEYRPKNFFLTMADCKLLLSVTNNTHNERQNNGTSNQQYRRNRHSRQHLLYQSRRPLGLCGLDRLEQIMRKQRLYGLFEKGESGRWQRLYPSLAYPKSQAVRVFQDALLAYSLGAVPNERRLRPIAD